MKNRITKYDLIISAIIFTIGVSYIFSQFIYHKKDQNSLNRQYPTLNLNDSINDIVKNIYYLPHQNNNRRAYLEMGNGRYLTILSYSLSNNLSVGKVIGIKSKLVKLSGSDSLMVINYLKKDSTVHYFKLEY